MEIVIIVGMIGAVVTYILLTPKTPSEIAQKRNPAFKSSLRHNPDHQNPEEVFKVLKEANISPCFLDSELNNSNNNKTLTDTTLISSYLSKIRDDRYDLFNPQQKDNRSSLKVAKSGIKKVSVIKIESQNDAFDGISSELHSQLTDENQFEQRQEQDGPVLVKKKTPPRNIGNK